MCTGMPCALEFQRASGVPRRRGRSEHRGLDTNTMPCPDDVTVCRSPSDCGDPVHRHRAHLVFLGPVHRHRVGPCPHSRGGGGTCTQVQGLEAVGAPNEVQHGV